MDIDHVLTRNQPSLQALTHVLPPLVEALRSSPSDQPTFALRLEELSPAEREIIVTLREQLLTLDAPIRHRLLPLERFWPRARA